MLNSIPSRVALVAHAFLWGLLHAGASMAQTADAHLDHRPAPTPFNLYQRWQDEPVQDWRESNDRVGEIGGWKSYLRAAQQPGVGQAPNGGASDAPAHNHHGHHGH